MRSLEREREREGERKKIEKDLMFTLHNLQLAYKGMKETNVTWIGVFTKRSRTEKRNIPRLILLKGEALGSILQCFYFGDKKAWSCIGIKSIKPLQGIFKVFLY